MLFGKLLPTEGNFFVMFNQHADRIVEAAHAFSNLVANYGDPMLRDKYNKKSTTPSAVLTASRTSATWPSTKPSSRPLTASKSTR